MGYSRGANGKAGNSKLCGICFMSFPDAQDRKAHYKKFNCRDDLGNLGGLVKTGKCAGARERNISVLREKDALCDDDDDKAPILPEDLPALISYEKEEYEPGYYRESWGVNYGHCSKVFTDFLNYDEKMGIAMYMLFQHPKALWRGGFMSPVSSRKESWDVCLQNARYAKCNRSFDGTVFDTTGLGAEESVMRFDVDNLFLEKSFGDTFILSYVTKPVYSDKPLLPGDYDIMYHEMSSEWSAFFDLEEDCVEWYEEELEEMLYTENTLSPSSVLPSIHDQIGYSCEDIVEEAFTYESDDESCDPPEITKISNKKFGTQFIFHDDHSERPKDWVYMEQWFIDDEYPGKFIDDSLDLDPNVLFERLPLIGRTLLELMIELKINLTGNLCRDIHWTLFTYYEKVLKPTRKYLMVGGTPCWITCEDWRIDTKFLLLAPLIQGEEYRHLHVILEAPLPFFLRGFPKWRRNSESVEASGWSIVRYFSRQATMGFLDGVFEKMKELLSPVLKVATFAWDMIVKAKEYAFSLLEKLCEGRGSIWKNTIEPLMYVCVFFISLGLINCLDHVVSSLGIPVSFSTAAAVGVGVYMLVKFFSHNHIDALKRAEKIWDLVRFWDNKEESARVEQEVETLLVNSYPDQKECIGHLLRSDPVMPDCVIDLSYLKDILEKKANPNIVASGPSMLFSSGFMWKVVLLAFPLSTLGVSKTLSCAKDLVTIQGGQEAAGRFFQDMLSGTQEVFYSLTGKKNDFLDYISVTVGVDFQEWRDEVLELTTATPTSIFLGPDVRLKRLRSCRDMADRLILQMDSRKVPGAYITMFNHLSQALDKALIECQQALSVGQWRKTPACIWLFGESHVGKSVCSQYLIDDVLNVLDYAQTGRVFSRNGSDSFWSCYKNQSAVLYDDLGAVSEGGHFDEAELIRLIAPAPLPLNMPNLEAKGNTCCTSDFVFITANQAGLTPSAVVHNKKAFENRRLVLAEVKVVEGGKYRDRYRFTIHHRNEPYGRDDRHEVMNYDQFMNFVVAQSRRHFDEQSDLKDAPHSQIFSAADAIARDVSEGIEAMGLPVPLELMKSLDGNDLTFFCLEKAQEVVQTLDDLTASLLRGRVDPGILAMDFRSKLSKAAYINLKNQFAQGKNPFEEPNPYFSCSQGAKAIGRFLMPKVSEEQLAEDRRTFVHRMKEIACGVGKSFAEAPFLVKFLVGFGALYFIGLPLVGWMKSLFATTSMAGLAGLCVQSSGSLSSSQDQETRRMASGRQRRRYLLEASGAAGDIKGANVENQLRNLAKHQVGFTSMSNPDIKCRGIALGGTRILMVYHVWLTMMHNPGCYKVGSIEKTFPFTINPKTCKYQRIGLKDLVIVDFPPTFVSFTVLNLKSLLLSSHDPFVVGSGWFMEMIFQSNGVVEVAKEDADYSLLDTKETYDAAFLKGIGLNKCAHYFICNDEGNDYRKDFFYVTQCGTPLVANYGKDKGLKILSIHVAHHFSSSDRDIILAGSGSLITYEEYEEACLILGEPKHVLESDKVEASGYLGGEIFYDAETVFPLGLVEPKDAPRLATTSEIKKSTISDLVELECGEKRKTEPAIISVRDTRLPDKSADIFKKGMIKYKAVASDMSPVTEDEEKVWNLVWDEIFTLPGGIEKRCHVLSEDENLNGIPGDNEYRGMVVSTSEGWPEVLNRPHGESGKERFLLGVPGAYQLNKDLPMYQRLVDMEEKCKTSIPCIVGLDTPKDERLPLSKIYQDVKTRLFTILPMEYNFLVRKYFGSPVAELMKLHNDIPMKVGINPLGYDWTILGKKMYSKGNNWFNGDYSRFDGVTPRCLLIEISNRLSALCGDNHADIRLHLMLAATTRLGIAGIGLYRVSGGIPSGFALTVIVNSLVNHFLVRWSWENMMASTSLFFKDNVELAVVGDDNLVSVKEVATSRFNLRTLSDFLKGFGFTLKDGSDKTKDVLPDFNPPEKCDFLKRSFIPRGDRYLAPLAWVSLSETLHWVRETNMSNQAATRDNVEGFLRELFHYGDKSLYVKWRSDLLDICARRHVPRPETYSFEELERAWLSGSSVASIFSKVEPEIIVIRDSASTIAPGVCLIPVKQAFNFPVCHDRVLVWCGPNCPNQLKNHQRCFTIMAPQGKRYPLSNTARNFLKKVHAMADVVDFSGALDQSLVHWVAAMYASMYRKSFSFEKYMMSFFGDNVRAHTEAMVAAKGWSYQPNPSLIVASGCGHWYCPDCRYLGVGPCDCTEIRDATCRHGEPLVGPDQCSKPPFFE